MTASLFIVWSALQLMKPELKISTIWLIAAGGFIFILCSLPAVVISPMILTVVLVKLVKKQITLSKQSFFLIAVSWAMACLLLTIYAKFVISNTVQDAMSNYWSRGFLPLNNILDSFKWILIKLNSELIFFLATWIPFVLPSIQFVSLALLILSIPGIIFLFKKHHSVVIILFAPLLTAFLLAALRILPFDQRVAVYATWPLVFSGIAGIEALRQWIPRLFPTACGRLLLQKF